MSKVFAILVTLMSVLLGGFFLGINVSARHYPANELAYGEVRIVIEREGPDMWMTMYGPSRFVWVRLSTDQKKYLMSHLGFCS